MTLKCFYLQDLKAAEDRRDKKRAREMECLEKEKQLNKLKVKGKFCAYACVSSYAKTVRASCG